MLEAPLRESVIVNGISVLLVLLDVRKPAPQGQAHYPYTSDQVSFNPGFFHHLFIYRNK